jgi:hypothetical protein
VVERGEKQVAVRNSEILESEAREFPFLPFLIFLFPFFLTEKKNYWVEPRLARPKIRP